MKKLLTLASIIVGASSFNLYAQDNQSAATHESMGDSRNHGINAGESRVLTLQEREAENKKAIAQPAWVAHSLMSHTYLQAARDFIDGLDKQADKDTASMTVPVTKEHIRLYGRESLENLQRARHHLTELSASLSRDTAASQTKDRQQRLQAAQRDIDSAIRQDQTLIKRLSDNSFLKNKDAVKTQISQVKETIKDAMANQKDLFGTTSSVGEM